jgi:FMN phosphatase YigB (HAD superfamily)
MITDILFDLGKVLTPFNWDIAIQRLLPHLPGHSAKLLSGDKEAFIDLIREPSIELETGRIDFEAYRNIVNDILGIGLSSEEFHRIWCDIFRLDKEMIALGRFLSRHYRTWLVSNTSRVHYEWIVQHFPEVVFYRKAALSFELGVMKPAEEYYDKALGMFGISPFSALFIDDLEENVAAAIRCGMIGIVFHDREELIRRLRILNVKVPDEKERHH